MDGWSATDFKKVIIMSEIELRHRMEVAKSTPREVPSTSLEGFTVECKISLSIKGEGAIIFDDGGNFIGVVSSSEEMYSCPHCGGNFPCAEEPTFCAWCGTELKGDESMEEVCYNCKHYENNYCKLTGEDIPCPRERNMSAYSCFKALVE